ncbi:MAG: RNA methyltransferase [Candidatus Babeliaceae bacterium]|nr:RNA methyltransferase [Candidatus Babeliaceae bacterium]
MKKKSQSVRRVVVYGIHPILELLSAKKRSLLHVYTTKPAPRACAQIVRNLPAHVPISYVSKEMLNRLAGTVEHQGVVALAQPLPIRGKSFDPARQRFVVLIDGVQDTRNLGGIIRSASCTGVDGIVVPRTGCAPLNASVGKASVGLVDQVEIWQPPTAYKAALELKGAGYNLFMAALGGSDATTVSYKLPLCVVIGSEERGISFEVKRLGTTVMLPQRDPAISYNASVAAGILLFLVSHQNTII